MTNAFDTAAIAAAAHFKMAFGESIVLLPDGETERPVVAILNYQAVEEAAGMRGGKSRVVSITVDNHAVTGLSTAEFNSGTARAKIPERIGAAAVEKRIVKIIDQDAGMVTYKVQ